MKIVKNFVAKSKYNIKCPYTMKPTRIVVHNTANDASARNEIKYMISNANETSYHYAVDDIEVVQGIPENRNAWHASDGNGKGNREGIGIEICYSKSGGDKFIKAEQNAVELIVDILKRYGWGIDKVTKHQDYCTKYCPHRTLDMGWDRFIKMIEAKLNDKPTTNTSTGLYRVRKTWKDAATQIGAYKSLANAKKECKAGYSVFDEKGNVVYTVSATIKVGSTVKLKNGAKTYTGGKIASFVYGRKHKVKEIKGDRVVITYLGIVVAAVNLKDLTLV